MTTQATFDVPEPDPKAMYLRAQDGEVSTGRWAGTTFGREVASASLYLDVRYDGERKGIVLIPATILIGAVLDALEAQS